MNRLIGPILALIAVYLLFFYNDGALFIQLADRLGAWFGERLQP